MYYPKKIGNRKFIDSVRNFFFHEILTFFNNLGNSHILEIFRFFGDIMADPMHDGPFAVPPPSPGDTQYRYGHVDTRFYVFQ